MFATAARRLARAATEPVANRPPLTVHTNPYQATKRWPPNFAELNPQQQLRFEKKYKRRVGLACHSPGWIKGTKYAQLGVTAGLWARSLARSKRGPGALTLVFPALLVYMFGFAEFDFGGQKYKPSEEVCSPRRLFWGACQSDVHKKMRRHALTLFGIMDPERRYERRSDAPSTELPANRLGPEPK